MNEYTEEFGVLVFEGEHKNVFNELTKDLREIINGSIYISDALRGPVESEIDEKFNEGRNKGVDDIRKEIDAYAEDIISKYKGDTKDLEYYQNKVLNERDLSKKGKAFKTLVKAYETFSKLQEDDTATGETGEIVDSQWMGRLDTWIEDYESTKERTEREGSAKEKVEYLRRFLADELEFNKDEDFAEFASFLGFCENYSFKVKERFVKEKYKSIYDDVLTHIKVSPREYGNLSDEEEEKYAVDTAMKEISDDLKEELKEKIIKSKINSSFKKNLIKNLEKYDISDFYSDVVGLMKELKEKDFKRNKHKKYKNMALEFLSEISSEIKDYAKAEGVSKLFEDIIEIAPYYVLSKGIEDSEMNDINRKLIKPFVKDATTIDMKLVKKLNDAVNLIDYFKLNSDVEIDTVEEETVGKKKNKTIIRTYKKSVIPRSEAIKYLEKKKGSSDGYVKKALKELENKEPNKFSIEHLKDDIYKLTGIGKKITYRNIIEALNETEEAAPRWRKKKINEIKNELNELYARYNSEVKFWKENDDLEKQYVLEVIKMRPDKKGNNKPVAKTKVIIKENSELFKPLDKAIKVAGYYLNLKGNYFESEEKKLGDDTGNKRGE